MAPQHSGSSGSRSTGTTYEGVEGEPLAVEPPGGRPADAIAQLPLPSTARADVLDRAVRLVRMRGRRRAERPIVPRPGARRAWSRAASTPGHRSSATCCRSSGWCRAGSRRRSTTTASCARAGCASAISMCCAGSADEVGWHWTARHRAAPAGRRGASTRTSSSSAAGAPGSSPRWARPRPGLASRSSTASPADRRWLATGAASGMRSGRSTSWRRPPRRRASRS